MRRFTSLLNARPSQTSRLERRATLKHLQNRARYCKITRGLEAYRSGHNEPHSKCGDGQPSASSNLAASAKAKKAPLHGCFFAFSEARCGTLRLTATLPKNDCFPHSIRIKSTNRRKVRRLARQDACGFFKRLSVSCTLPKHPPVTALHLCRTHRRFHSMIGELLHSFAWRSFLGAASPTPRKIAKSSSLLSSSRISPLPPKPKSTLAWVLFCFLGSAMRNFAPDGNFAEKRLFSAFYLHEIDKWAQSSAKLLLTRPPLHSSTSNRYL